MKKVIKFVSVFAMIAAVLSCNNIAAVSGAEVIAVQEEVKPESKNVDDQDISIVTFSGVAYTSANLGQTWSYVKSNVDSITGGADDRGNFLINEADDTISHDKGTSWGFFEDITYCEWTHTSFAIDKDGAVWEYRSTEWHTSYYKLENQPPTALKALDLDGYGNLFGISQDGQKIYRLARHATTWTVYYEIGSISAITSFYDIGCGDRDIYATGGVRMMGHTGGLSNVVIPSLMKVGTSGVSIKQSYVHKVDVSKDSFGDCVWTVFQSHRGVPQGELYKQTDSEGTMELVRSGDVSDIGCTIY